MRKLNVDFLSKFNKFYIIKLVSSVLVQVSSLFLVYLLPAKEYGYLALLMSVSSLMFVLTSAWSNGAVINLGSKSFAEKGSYSDIVFYRFIIVISGIIILSILYLLFKTQIISFLHVSKNYGLAYILFLGLVAYDFSYQLLYPGNKDTLQSVLEFSAAILIFAGMVILVKNIKGYVYVYSIISGLFAVLTISFFLYYFGFKNARFNFADFKYVLQYSFWQVLSVIGIYIVNVGMNYIFVFSKISPTEIGQYNFAFKLFSGFSAFFALFGIVIPKWVHTKNENIGQILSKRIMYIVGLLTVFYIIIALILHPFLLFVGKTDYLASAKFYFMLFPAFIFMAYTNLLNTVVANTSFFKNAQYAVLIQVIVLLLVCFPLVHYIDVVGAIIATTVSYIVCSFYFFQLYRNKILPYFKQKNSF